MTLLTHSPEASYRHISPQLAARTRQMWSARGLDLDRLWGAAVAGLPGFCALDFEMPPETSAPVDQLFLFDQGVIWVQSLRVALRAGRTMPGLGLSRDQREGLAALSARLTDELAGLRMLAIAGLATPALQVARAISEDVDLALVLMLRPKVATQFTACRTPEAASDFWRRHIAGGRAFRTVAERLYHVGLDHSEDSEYGRWRKEALAFLGTAVHSSFISGQPVPEETSGLPGRAGDALGFSMLRLQEMCAYSHVLSPSLHDDLAAILAARCTADTRPDLTREMLRYAVRAGEIIVDQMRWGLRQQVEPASGPLH